MEQSGAEKNGMGGILTSLGAQNTIQICRQMRLDLTIPNSLIGLPCLAGVAECQIQNDSRNLYGSVPKQDSQRQFLYVDKVLLKMNSYPCSSVIAFLPVSSVYNTYLTYSASIGK